MCRLGIYLPIGETYGGYLGGNETGPVTCEAYMLATMTKWPVFLQLYNVRFQTNNSIDRLPNPKMVSGCRL